MAAKKPPYIHKANKVPISKPFITFKSTKALTIPKNVVLLSSMRELSRKREDGESSTRSTYITNSCLTSENTIDSSRGSTVNLVSMKEQL